MGHPENRADLTKTLVVLAACLVAGCAVPGHFGRCHVSADLEERTGHGAGAETPPCEVAIPDLVSFEDGLSQSEAVALGLWNNPGYQELLADLKITSADVIQAHQLANPEVSTMFPVSVKQWEFALTVPLDVLLLRPHRVEVAQLESNRVAERLVQDGLDVVRDIRVAYADLILARQRLQLAEDFAKLRSELLRIAEARLEAGAVAELDVTAMRLDSLFSEEHVARTTRDVDLAREKLRFLIGVESTDFEVEPTGPAEVPSTEFDVDTLVGEAVASRPDLRAVKMAVAAACERERLAHYDYLNFSGILPDINSKGQNGFEAGPGLRMMLPIFHQNQGAIARAEAEVERLRRQYARLRDTASLEVRQAHTRLLQARQDLEIWRGRVVPQAEVAVATARKALEEEGVSLLFVLDTTRQLLDARQRELQAATDVHHAIAELERSVGRRLVDEPAIDESAEPTVAPEPPLPPEPPSVEEVTP
ncbi:MAG: TolC family protein [Planctomycetota bacterium]